MTLPLPPITSEPAHINAIMGRWPAAHIGRPRELGRIVVYPLFFEYPKLAQLAILAHELAHAYRHAAVLPPSYDVRYTRSQLCQRAEEAICDHVSIMLTSETEHLAKRDWVLPRGRRMMFYIQQHAAQTYAGIRSTGWSVEELWSKIGVLSQ